jgi:hypothetical protein
MSGDATRADAPRPSLWNDGCAQRLDEPGRWLYPSHGLGGGNFWPQVDAIKFYRYRQRSLLRVGVYPVDIAEAFYCFAPDLWAKSAGNILNVDAGAAVAFAR